MLVSPYNPPANCHPYDIQTIGNYRILRASIDRVLAYNSLEAFERLLSDYPDFDLRMTVGEKRPLLHTVIRHCDVEFVQILLRHGGCFSEVFDAVDEDGQTSLTLACQLKKSSIVKVLCDAGANVNTAEHVQASTPLICAVQQGDIETVRLLCDAGANRELTDRDHCSAMTYAIYLDNVSIVTLLHEKGATADGDNVLGHSLCMAAAKGHVRTLEALLSLGGSAHINMRAKVTGAPPLFFAAMSTNAPDVVDMLRKRGASLSAVDYRGYTALMVAAEMDNVSMIRALLMLHDKDIDAKSYDKFYGTMHKDEESYRKAVSQLNVLTPERGVLLYGETALMIAARRGNHRAVYALLGAQPTTDARNHRCYTALMLASETGTPQVISALCGHGASTSLTNDKGWPPLAIAISRGRVDNVEALIAHKANVDQYIDNNNGTPLMLAARLGHAGLISILHRAGANIAMRDRDGNDALLAAVLSGSLPAVQALLSVGAAVDAPNTAGFSPLMAAAQCNHVEALRLLIQAGADFSRKTDQGWTAKTYAIHATATRAVEFLEGCEQAEVAVKAMR